MEIGRGIRAVVAGVLWTAAVLVGLFGVAGFVGTGAECARNAATRCASPNAAALGIAIVVAVALGVVGALVWRPRPRGREPRRPWDYPS